MIPAHRAPRLALWTLRVVLPREDFETISGDLEESLASDIADRLGARGARRWYWRQVAGIVISLAADRLRSRRESHAKGTALAAARQDIAYALRSVRKQPGFAVTAVLTLSLGIGANVAIFSVVNALLLKPLPFRDADRLMLVHLLAPRPDGRAALSENVWSYPKYQRLAERQQVFDSMSLFGDRTWSLTDTESPERLRGELAGGRFFEVLGASPVVGRAFGTSDDVIGNAPIAVIGYGLWMRRYGGDRAVLGQAVHLNKVAHTIVGVMPAGFRGLSGQAEVWVPMATEPVRGQLDNPTSHSYFLVAKLKPTASVERAASDVRSIGDALNDIYPVRYGARWSASATPLERERTDPAMRRALFVLLAAVAAVLLIGCANLAIVMIARTLGRTREVGVRLALGASPFRIVRQFLTEALVLATVGAAGGLFAGWALLRGARALMPDLNTALRFGGTLGIERAALTRRGLELLGLDLTTVVVTAAVAVVAALLFGLGPAWQAAHRDLTASVRSGSDGALAPGTRGVRMRALLVATEIAAALVLVVACGLMLRTLAKLQQTPLGFDPRDVVSLRLSLPSAQYDPARAGQLFEQLTARLEANPEIHVALGLCAPLSGPCSSTDAEFPGRPPAAPGARPLVGVYWASTGYFDTLGIQLLRGRGFTDRDRVGQPKVVVINETAARALWKDEDPIGKRISVGQGGFGGQGAEVVGIVRDVRYNGVEKAPMPDVYIPILQSPRQGVLVFVRGRMPTASMAGLVAAEMRALDADVPLSDIKRMEERVADATWRTRAVAWLLSLFGSLALLLASIGVFGVMSQSVAERRREIGVRMALGAAPRDISAMIVGRAARVSIAGVIVGFAASLSLMRVLGSLLFEVDPRDPATFWTVAGIVLTVALVASYLPARRAARVDPLTTMRAE